MTDNTLTLKLTRNPFFKSKQYTVKVDGSGTQVLNYSNSQTELKMLSGKYAIEVSNGSLFSKTEVTLGIGEHKSLQIYPAVTFELMRFILVVIALITLIVQYLITNTFALFPLFFVPVIPLLFLRKKQFPESFAITFKQIS